MSRRIVIVALLAAVVAGACTQQDGVRPASACQKPPALKNAGKLPSDIPLPRDSEPVAMQRARGFLSVRAIEQTTVKEAFTESSERVVASGFEILNTDYEGFEAEIFFARERTSQGVVSLRKGPCRGDVMVTVVYDPVDTKRGRKALGKTRSLNDASNG